MPFGGLSAQPATKYEKERHSGPWPWTDAAAPLGPAPFNELPAKGRGAQQRCHERETEAEASTGATWGPAGPSAALLSPLPPDLPAPLRRTNRAAAAAAPSLSYFPFRSRQTRFFLKPETENGGEEKRRTRKAPPCCLLAAGL